jgi:cation:H+ antiporter
MVSAVLLLLVGAAVLTLGAEAAVRGAGRLAEAKRISPFMLGALLFGVDIESLGAVLTAAGRGQTSIAAGEAFGTVVFLFSAAFGVALLLARRPVESPPVEMVLLPGVAVVVGAATLSDQVVSRVDGLLLLLVYAAYLVEVLRQRRPVEDRGKEIVREAQEGPAIPPMVLLVAGLGLVYGGAMVLVEGGTQLLARTSLAAGFVGGAVIGTLASLDEVLLEVLPILRGLPDLAMGNLFGTVAAFTTGVLGLAALIRPLHVDSAGTSAFVALAFLYSLVSTAFLLRGRVWRGVGLTTIGVYALWLAYTVRL